MGDKVECTFCTFFCLKWRCLQKRQLGFDWVLVLNHKVWKTLPVPEIKINIAIKMKCLLSESRWKIQVLVNPNCKTSYYRALLPLWFCLHLCHQFCLVGVCLSNFNCWVEEPTSVVFPLFFPVREKAVRFLDTASGLNLLQQCSHTAALFHNEKSDTFSFPKLLQYFSLLSFFPNSYTSKKIQDFYISPLDSWA